MSAIAISFILINNNIFIMTLFIYVKQNVLQIVMSMQMEEMP